MTPRPIPAARGVRAGGVALALALLLAGCTSDDPKPTASPSATTTASATATPTASEAARTARVSFEVSAGDADAAARVLHARLLAFGLDPGDPEVSGKTVAFQVTRPPTSAEATLLSRGGHLTFRPVVSVGAQGQCTDPGYRIRLGAENGGREDDTRRVEACDATGDAKYVLGPAEMTGTDVQSAEANADVGGPIATGAWIVTMTMRSAAEWQELTAKYTGQQLAIVLDGVVQFAPNIEQAIPDGTATISGDFTETTARALAGVLRGGALPANAVVTVSG